MRTHRGFSIIELLVAIIIMGLVMAGAMNFFIGQSKTFRRGSTDITLLQNVRFANDLLAQHFRAVGANTTVGQPPIIFASDQSLSFNADYAANSSGDSTAIYLTPSAPSDEVEAPTTATQFAIPGSSIVYPKADYEIAPGMPSFAETITFWFAPDTETTRSDDWVMLRQSNGTAPEVIVRNVLPDSVPFFRYMFLRKDASGTQSIDTVPAATLPLSYGEFGAKDTLTARLRAVIVSFRVTNGLTGPDERTRPLTLVEPFPNMSKIQLQTCGNDPLPMSAPVAAAGPGKSMDITWDADGDESDGERDITRYVIWRRVVGDLEWHEPLLGIPAGGTATYLYNDQTVKSGVNYEYAIAAQDCTPAFSDPVKSNQVLAP